jgi:hypothetical protein
VVVVLMEILWGHNEKEKSIPDEPKLFGTH